MSSPPLRPGESFLRWPSRKEEFSIRKPSPESRRKPGKISASSSTGPRFIGPPARDGSYVLRGSLPKGPFFGLLNSGKRLSAQKREETEQVSGRRALLSTASAFVLATALLLLTYRFNSHESDLLSSAGIAIENKRALYLSRNVEETFWQTLAETAESCAECEPGELSILASANVANWKNFWEEELGDSFSGNPELSFSARATEPGNSGIRHFSFSIKGEGFSIPVGTGRTIAFIGGGEERGCFVALSGEPSCAWE